MCDTLQRSVVFFSLAYIWNDARAYQCCGGAEDEMKHTAVCSFVLHARAVDPQLVRLAIPWRPGAGPEVPGGSNRPVCRVRRPGCPTPLFNTHSFVIIC